jgi:hypothetical protein
MGMFGAQEILLIFMAADRFKADRADRVET